MGKVIIEEQNLIDIANSIRSKLNTTNTFKPSEMNEAINSIKTPTLPEKGIIINEFDSDGYVTDVTVVGFTQTPSYYLGSNGNIALNAIHLRLTKVEINEGLSILNSQTFRYAISLKSVILPSSLTQIKMQCFDGCRVLDKIIIKATIPPTLANDTNIFSDTPIAKGTGYIYVPDESVEAYKTTQYWTTYASQIKGISELEG